MEANGLGAGADPSQGAGKAGVHRQTLDGEHGSVKQAAKTPRDERTEKKYKGGMRPKRQGQKNGQRARAHDDGGDGGGDAAGADDGDGAWWWWRGSFRRLPAGRASPKGFCINKTGDFQRDTGT